MANPVGFSKQFNILKLKVNYLAGMKARVYIRHDTDIEGRAVDWVINESVFQTKQLTQGVFEELKS